MSKSENITPVEVPATVNAWHLLGWLRQDLQRDGQITVEAWNAAVEFHVGGAQ